MKLRHLLIAGGLAAAVAAPAFADLTYTQGSGTTIFDFLCFTTKHCSAHTPINSAGTEIMTTAAPGQVQVGDGTNQVPVKAASTAAAAADKSFVTNESPNSQLSVTTGTTSDTAYNGSGNSTLSAVLRGIYAILTTINTNVQSAIAAGTAYIGQIGIDPSKGGATAASAAINVSTATTTQLVAISGSTKIYVTSFDVVAGGTGNITFVYGTGSSCGTGTTSLTGAYNLTAQAGISKGSGTGSVLVVPSGNALCVTTTAAVQMSGSVSYQQF